MNIRATGDTRIELLNEKQAANHLSIAAATLSVWRSTGRYNLPYVKVGHAVRYRLSELDAWLAAHSKNSTRFYGAEVRRPESDSDNGKMSTVLHRGEREKLKSLLKTSAF